MSEEILKFNRRDFLKVAGLSLLAACSPKPKYETISPTSTPEKPEFKYVEFNQEHNILFTNELEQLSLRVDWESFSKTSEFFGFASGSLKDLDIKITSQILPINPTIGKEEEFVETKITNKRGSIKVAGGNILRSVLEAKPSNEPRDIPYEELILSFWNSHAVFFGYSYLDYLKGNVTEDTARGMALTYINLLFNGLLPPMIQAQYRNGSGLSA